MRRALALLGLLLAPAAAWADPISLVAALAPYIGGAAAAAVVTYAGQALLVGLYVYGAARARRKARAAQAKARAEYNASLQDRSVTALQALPTWRIVPGRCITGGDIHAIFTTDKTGYREDGTTYTRPDALKHLVIVFADHEIEAFHEFFLDGVAVGPLDGNGYCTSGEFYSARTDSRIAYLEGDGTVTVPQPVVSVLNAYVQTGYGEYYDVTDVSGSISLASGNTVINGPANAIVNYLVQADLGSVRIQQHLGTASQAVDSYLNGILPSKWTSTDRLLGKAYIVLTLDLENQRFQGAPPGITADISGRKVYDPRKDSTVAGGSGSQRNNDANTWAWSDNPALAVRDYITAEWGVAAAQADVHEAYVIAAANACDARSSAAAQSKADTVTASASADTIIFAAEQPYTVGDGVRFTSTGTLPGGLSAGTTYYLVRGRDLLNYGLATSVANAYAGTTLDITSAGTGTHTCTFYDYATYKCNGAFNVQDGQREAVLDDLCESMGGNAWEGGQWEIVAAAWTATVMDLGDDDLAGQIEIVQADTPLEQLCNGVRGTFIPAGKSVPVEFDNYSNATFVSDDGQEHWDDIALPFVDTRFRARNLCRIRVETGRNGQIIRYPAKLKAWPLQRGDRVRVSSTEYGLSLKTYRVTDWQDAPTAVILTLQEDDSAAYDLADAATSDATPNTGLGSPRVVQSVTLGTITSGDGIGYVNAGGIWVPRVKVPWTALTDPYMADGAGRIVVLWRTPRDGTVWQRQEVLSSETSALLEGVREGDFIVVEVYARNALGDIGPSSFASHTVATTNNGTIGGGNLLRNSDFDVDSDSNGVPDSWLIYNNGTVGSTTYSLQPSGGVGDGAYLRVQASNLGTSSSDQVGAHQIVNLDGFAGSKVCFTSYIYGLGGGSGSVNVKLFIDWYDALNGVGSIVSSSEQLISRPPVGWARYQLIAEIPAGALSCRAYLWMQERGTAAGAAEILFDKVQFEIGAVPTSYAPRADELLPGVVSWSYQATDSNTYAVTAGANDPPDPAASITFEVAATDTVVVTVQCEFVMTNSTAASIKSFDGNIYVNMDGSGYAARYILFEIENVAATRTDSRNLQTTYVFDGLSAGSHTVGFRWALTSSAGATATDIIRGIKTSVLILKA